MAFSFIVIPIRASKVIKKAFTVKLVANPLIKFLSIYSSVSQWINEFTTSDTNCTATLFLTDILFYLNRSFSVFTWKRSLRLK